MYDVRIRKVKTDEQPFHYTGMPSSPVGDLALALAVASESEGKHTLLCAPEDGPHMTDGGFRTKNPNG